MANKIISKKNIKQHLHSGNNYINVSLSGQEPWRHRENKNYCIKLWNCASLKPSIGSLFFIKNTYSLKRNE